MKLKCKMFSGVTADEADINKFLETEIDSMQYVSGKDGKHKIEKIMRPPTICHVVSCSKSIAIFYM